MILNYLSMAIIGYSLLLLISFYILAEIGDKYFVPSLDKISKRLNLSHDMAGATLMAAGSSAPEIFVAIMALFRPGDHADLGVGTIVGSAIFNLLAIIGVAGIVKKSVIAWQPVVRDLFFYAVSIVAFYIVLINGRVTLYEAIIFILMYAIYVYSVINWKKWFQYEEIDLDPIVEKEAGSKYWWKSLFKPIDWFIYQLIPRPEKYILVFLISILLIAATCWVLVESAIHVSAILGIPEMIIALIVLGIGTSVPDIVSSAIVAKQGRGGMAVSNAVGSNIFDIFIGLGLPWLLKSIIFGQNINTSTDGLGVAVGLLLGSVLLILFALMYKKWTLNKGLGYTLVLLYILFVIWEILNLYLF
jgi:K+-dependent Na+/Ca+ exchanger-like protein